MIYLTYNDYPSGIYSSQVIDVCSFLNGKLNADIRLVSLVSLRGYFKTRKKIRVEFSNAIILPMFPGVQNWKGNVFVLFFLFLFMGKQSVIARGPFAVSLALSLKKNNMVNKVCFDARGAYDAEFNEYDVTRNTKINKDILSIERKSILNADFRIAVSYKLLSYWKEKFGYNQDTHVVIPCTINSYYLEKPWDQNKIELQRRSLGYADNDVIFVYSGYSAGWQSLKLVDDFLVNQMKQNQNAKVLFLINKFPDNMKIMDAYADRVAVKWLKEDQVADALLCCDYGLLLRNKSTTNVVASPVKFAEYLSTGLKVIISGSIGDYSEFVQKNNCGYVVDFFNMAGNLLRLRCEEKKHNINIAKEYFSKEKYLNQYSTMMNHIM